MNISIKKAKNGFILRSTIEDDDVYVCTTIEEVHEKVDELIEKNNEAEE